MHSESHLRRWARWWRHRWMSDNAALQAVPLAMAERLQARVQASESRHSGEVVLCVEGALPNRYLWRIGREASLDGVVRERALSWFGKLRVWDTAHNNGVLIYLLLAERRIEVVADRGLSAQVAPEVWQAMVRRMGAAFKQGAFEAGLALAVDEIRALLVQHFALAPGEANPNELPDQPHVG